jgi:hypothetical protein
VTRALQDHGHEVDGEQNGGDAQMPFSGVIAPFTYVTFPSTVLLPRDSRVELKFCSPTSSLVTVEFEMRMTPPNSHSTPARASLAITQASMFDSALRLATSPGWSPDATEFAIVARGDDGPPV